MYKKLSYLLIVLATWQCSRPLDVPDPLDSYQYFPINVGDEKTFELIRVSYAVGVNEQKDTITVKETVQSKKETADGTVYQILRTTKGKNDLFFKPELTFHNIVGPGNVVSIEKNIYKVLLKFPIFEGSIWDINSLNTDDEKEAEVTYYNELPTGLITDKNIYKIEIEDSESAVGLNRNYAFYAKGMGNIYSEFIEIEYCQDGKETNDPSTCFGKFIISSGVKEYKRLTEFKKVE